MSEKSRFCIFFASLSRELNRKDSEFPLLLCVCFFYANYSSILLLQCRIVSRDLDLEVRERGNERKRIFFQENLILGFVDFPCGSSS